jgi:type IV pilus assembly protein PilM
MNFGWKESFKLELETKGLMGLDIGSSEVKLIQMRKDTAGYVVTAAGAVGIEAKKDKSNRREAKTVRAIRKCLELAGARTQMAVCSLSGPEVAIRHFRFPSLPLEEIEGAIQLEAAQVCPFNTDEGAVDYQIISDGADGVCGVLVAATNDVITTKRQLTKDASLACVLMDVNGLALLNCFNGLVPAEYEKKEAARTTAIFNVGSSYTTLAIMGDNGLPFIRDIAYAGDAIIEQIAGENDMSAEAVRKALSGDSAEAQLELRDSLATACRKLIVDVTETLRYYTAQEKSAIVEEVFVCGGFALVKGFVELLDSHLPARAVLWNPFDRVRCEAGQPCKDTLETKGPAMAVAAGLAMRSI